MTIHAPRAAGLDFGTTNSVLALAPADGGAPRLAAFGGDAVFRSALCCWQDDGVRGGLGVEAGPAAIREYLEDPGGSRFLQSFKTVAASASFDAAPVFHRRLPFEELGRLFLDRLAAQADGAMAGLDRLVVGRPVRFAGAAPDEGVARARYDAMFAGRAREVAYVYEPLAAAFGHAAGLDRPATLLVADFGGGTSDFSVVRVEAPGTSPRCVPLGQAGVGLAGDRFDQRIVERLVLPRLGKGGQYRSFDRLLDIPGGWYADFADWSRLALMRNRRTLDELARLRRTAVDPDAIGRMIALIEGEGGFALYDAVARVKRDLSAAPAATFRFAQGGVAIEAAVARADFEAWIADDVARMAAAVDEALAAAGVAGDQVDRVFLTGGTSLVPAVRRLFTDRFGEARIASGGELTSIAHGLALIAAEPDPAAWAAP